MSMRSDRMKRGRIRRRRSELDWFAEDPWAEEVPAAESDPADWAWEDEQAAGLLGASDEDEWSQDEYDH